MQPMRIGSVATTPTLETAAAPTAKVAAVQEIPPKRTLTAPADVRAALARAHQEATGEPASAPLLDVLTAHVSHETARGTHMFNYNFGGIKGHGPTGESARLRTREVTSKGDEVMRLPFRAYRTLEAGAADYLQLMQARYGEALDQARGGDAAGFAAALKRRGYYTASEESYTNAMRSLTSDPAAMGRIGQALPVTLAPHAARYSPALAPASAPVGPDQEAMLTTMALARVMDSLASNASRIGAPDPAEDGEI